MKFCPSLDVTLFAIVHILCAHNFLEIKPKSNRWLQGDHLGVHRQQAACENRGLRERLERAESLLQQHAVGGTLPGASAAAGIPHSVKQCKGFGSREHQAFCRRKCRQMDSWRGV